MLVSLWYQALTFVAPQSSHPARRRLPVVDRPIVVAAQQILLLLALPVRQLLAQAPGKRWPLRRAARSASHHRATPLTFSTLRNPAMPSMPDSTTHSASVSSMGGDCRPAGTTPRACSSAQTQISSG